MTKKSLKKFLKKFNLFRIGKFGAKDGHKKQKHAYAIFLFAVLIVFGIFLVPGETTFQYADYKVGTVAKEEIIAPETFPIWKTEDEIEEERRTAVNSILAQFYRDDETERQAVTNLSAFFNQLGEYRDVFASYSEVHDRSRARRAEPDSALVRQTVELQARLDAISDRFRQEHNIDIDKPYWNFIREMDDRSFFRFRLNCIQIMSDILAIGMVNVPKSRSAYEGIDLVLQESGEISSTHNINEFVDNEAVQEEISRRLQNYYTYPSDSTSAGFELIRNFIIPNIKYDMEETERLRRDSVAKVALTRGFVQQNERIIDRHERVTEDHYHKIDSLRRFLTERGLLQNKFSRFLRYLGQAGFLVIVLMFFVIYLVQFRPRILRDMRNVNILFLIFLSQLFFIHLITRQLGLSEYTVPITIGSMLLAILFDGGIGFYGTIVLSFIVGGFLGYEFSVTLYSLAGGIAAVLSVRRIRTRNQFFRSMIYIFVAYAIVLFTTGIMRMMPLAEITKIAFVYSLPNAIFSPLITLGFLALFESIFNAATDMTLLELSDLNRPLLRELALRAPGTYHHSIVLGNLSERAAEAIGANSLLARVGCYYHDIGKMVKPEYFIENQPDAKERHDSLAPSMSSLIISSHVRDGVEIAKKYKLPNVIQSFIVQHHGTSKISFFYEKAVEKSGSKYINESDFRYPGPKPQTKETGIVMLADGVEAATRALKDPSTSRIRERVRSIVDRKFQEGQLDECELTMRDLNAITESFIQILTGIFHTRIEYPPKDEGKPQTKEEKIIEQPD